MQRLAIVVCAFLLACAGCQCKCGGDIEPAATSSDQEKTGQPAKLSQATFGGGIYRNMVNLIDKNVPTDWNCEEGKFKNIKWVAKLGTETHSVPVVYGGRVFIGTNDGKAEEPKAKGKKKAKDKKAVVMCFAEKDGALLWKNEHAMPNANIVRGFDHIGMCATPTVEGDFVYYCAPACEVICAQVADGKIVWRYDMMKELNVYPCYVCACSPLIIGDMMFVVTGNGTDAQEKVAAPKAPSFLALDKKSGKPLWQSSLPGENIIQGQWSNPVYAEVNGKPQVIFGGGDGYLYGLEPKTGDMIWKFKCSPTQTEEDRGIPQYIVATPVVHENRVYVAVGDYPGRGDPPRIGHFFCVDITKSGDVSCKNDDFNPKNPVNKDSALIWHYGGLVKPPPEQVGARRVHMGYSCSTVAVQDGLVYLAECPGYLHCLDAKTGEHYWEHDFQDGILGSPYWVDGKIYVLTEQGECCIFEHGKKHQRPKTINMEEGSLESTPVVANGVLFIATPSKLYAISAKQ